MISPHIEKKQSRSYLGDTNLSIKFHIHLMDMIRIYDTEDIYGARAREVEYVNNHF